MSIGPNVLPEGYPYDPLTMNGGLIAPNGDAGQPSQYQPSAVKGAAWVPSWKFVPPPGYGDAPQHVWATLELIPFSIDGAGDRPVSYLRSFVAPIIQNFQMRFNGMPIEGGNLLLTGLYTPEPLTSLGLNGYAGS